MRVTRLGRTVRTRKCPESVALLRPISFEPQRRKNTSWQQFKMQMLLLAVSRLHMYVHARQDPIPTGLGIKHINVTDAKVDSLYRRNSLKRTHKVSIRTTIDNAPSCAAKRQMPYRSLSHRNRHHFSNTALLLQMHPSKPRSCILFNPIVGRHRQPWRDLSRKAPG